MDTTISSDGTPIAFERTGSGPPVVLVDGGFGHLQRGEPLPADRWAEVAQPVQVLVGGRSPTWMRTSMRSLADTLPDGRHRVLERQMHVVDGAAVAPPLIEFHEGT